METFAELHVNPALKKGLDGAGYVKPFPIQERAIAPLLQGKDLIGQAKAGSGKTLAFGIPLLQAVDHRVHAVQALVLAPTRELAVQITQELRRIGAHTGLRIITIYGGQSINLQLDELRKGVQVVVGTPGRTIDHMKRGTLKLSSVKYMVLDEADTMLDMGFIDDVEYILNAVPPHRQLSLFSATMPNSIVRLSRRYMTNPEEVIIDRNEPSAETLEQFYARVPRDKKLELLLEVLGGEASKSAVVFCRTRWGAVKLARELERRFISVAPLHGDLSQNQRDHSMSHFRSGKAEVLVATDVASRGIDVRQIDTVVNFDTPEDPVVYFHRVGRTARAGDVGKSFTFVSPDEEADFMRIQALARAPIKPLRDEDGRQPMRARRAGGGGERHGWRRRGGGGKKRGGPMKQWRRYR